MKSKYIYIPVILIVIILGISSRRFPETLPEFITLHFGDVLWAAMVYFGFRFLFFEKSLLISAVLALAYSLLIELSQLYQATWINAIRTSALGALVLGSGFLYIDLFRYTAGVVLACLTDIFAFRGSRKKPTKG